MKIGYARVSRDAQELARQLDALNHYGVDVLHEEKMTGTRRDRPELDKVKLQARVGDTVVIESLSRLGRSTRDLLDLLEEFHGRQVNVVSLKENLDMSTPTGRLLVTVLAAISQFERDTTVQRTKEGLAAARARGRMGGRPPVDDKAIRKALQLHAAGVLSVQDICRQTGISPATLYRRLRK